MMNAESVKARLKNLAAKTGHTFHEALTYYGLERTIYRISVSPYAEHFILKGGIFLYAIFDGDYQRATTDIDLLARRISNSRDEMKAIFKDIPAQDIDDSLIFDPDKISVTDITEFKKYHGLHISAVGYLGRTKIPVAIDIGYGDVIYPDVKKILFPVILNMEPPKINAYSLESSIAEKLEAIIHNGYLNSRYKDFYDIYVLSRTYAFTYLDMRSAVTETFSHRITDMTMDSAVFSDDFIHDTIHQTRWDSFLKRKKALIQIPISDAMNRIKVFIKPLLQEPDQKLLAWNPKEGCWE